MKLKGADTVKLILDGPDPSLDEIKEFYGSMVKNSSVDTKETFQKDDVSQHVQRGVSDGKR